RPGLISQFTGGFTVVDQRRRNQCAECGLGDDIGAQAFADRLHHRNEARDEFGRDGEAGPLLAAVPGGHPAEVEHGDHLAAEQVVLSGAAVFTGEDQAARHIPDVHQVETAVDHGGDTAPGRVAQVAVDPGKRSSVVGGTEYAGGVAEHRVQAGLDHLAEFDLAGPFGPVVDGEVGVGGAQGGLVDRAAAAVLVEGMDRTRVHEPPDTDRVGGLGDHAYALGVHPPGEVVLVRQGDHRDQVVHHF